MKFVFPYAYCMLDNTFHASLLSMDGAWENTVALLFKRSFYCEVKPAPWAGVSLFPFVMCKVNTVSPVTMLGKTQVHLFNISQMQLDFSLWHVLTCLSCSWGSQSCVLILPSELGSFYLGSTKTVQKRSILETGIDFWSVHHELHSWLLCNEHVYHSEVVWAVKVGTVSKGSCGIGWHFTWTVTLVGIVFRMAISMSIHKGSVVVRTT